MKHVLFYDASCPFCQRAVAWLLRRDGKGIFGFAPLAGKTADRELTGDLAELRKKNTLILLENYQTKKIKIWTYGRGAMRALWLIGGRWKLLGALCFLPFGIDSIYRFIAHHRHKLSSKSSDLTSFAPDRFLP